MLQVKYCPLCSTIKSLDRFGVYFSKERNKYRPQNYCMDCQPGDSKKRAKAYYEANKESRKQYARDFRKNPSNREKLEKISKEFKIKYRNDLKDCYVRDRLKQENGISAEVSREYPELVEAKRLKIKINRKIKQIKNAKK